MDEAEHCNELALIYGGHIIAKGAPRELKRSALERGIVQGSAERLPSLEDVFVSLVEAA